MNLVEKSGSWFSYKGERIGQGRENAKQFLKDNKDIAAKIETEVRKSLGLDLGGGQGAGRSGQRRSRAQCDAQGSGADASSGEVLAEQDGAAPRADPSDSANAEPGTVALVLLRLPPRQGQNKIIARKSSASEAS